jgi:sigma-70-like protein
MTVHNETGACAALEESAPDAPPAPSSAVLVRTAKRDRERERNRRRNSRPHEVRAVTINLGRLSEKRLAADRAEAERLEREAPVGHITLPLTRSECVDGPRPCPFVSCRYHLYLVEPNERGNIKLVYPDREPWELEATCALDIAARRGQSLDRVAALLNVTRERVRQIEKVAFAKLRGRLAELHGDDVERGRRKGRRRLPIVGP